MLEQPTCAVRMFDKQGTTRLTPCRTLIMIAGNVHSIHIFTAEAHIRGVEALSEAQKKYLYFQTAMTMRGGSKGPQIPDGHGRP